MHSKGMAARMPLLRSQLRSEPEEVNMASSVVAIGTLGCGGRIRRGGRQNAYATFAREFLALSITYGRPTPPIYCYACPRKAESYLGQGYADRKARLDRFSYVPFYHAGHNPASGARKSIGIQSAALERTAVRPRFGQASLHN